jgi:hypothetical protein
MSFVITTAGVIIRRPEVSYYLRMETLVGRVGESFSPVVVRRMDSKATFGFLTNM